MHAHLFSFSVVIRLVFLKSAARQKTIEGDVVEWHWFKSNSGNSSELPLWDLSKLLCPWMRSCHILAWPHPGPASSTEPCDFRESRRNRWWPVSLAQCKWWLPTTAAQACRRQNKTLEGILRCRKLAAASVQFGPQSLCVVAAVCRQTVKNCRSEETKNLFPFLLSLCTEISLSFGSQDCISKLVVDKKYSSYETIF